MTHRASRSVLRCHPYRRTRRSCNMFLHTATTRVPILGVKKVLEDHKSLVDEPLHSSRSLLDGGSGLLTFTCGLLLPCQGSIVTHEFLFKGLVTLVLFFESEFAYDLVEGRRWLRESMQVLGCRRQTQKIVLWRPEMCRWRSSEDQNPHLTYQNRPNRRSTSVFRNIGTFTLTVFEIIWQRS